MRLILVGLLTTASAAAACLQVESEHIRARDLVVIAPELRSLAPDTVFGYAPQPGAIRVISPEELRRFAAANGVQVENAAEMCVAYPIHPLDRTAMAQAMKAFLDPEVELDIIDFTRVGVPAGRLVFDGKGLVVPAEPSSEPVLWRGSVLYGDRRAAPVWARVRLTVQRTEVVAARDLQAGHKITTGDIRVDTRDAPLSKRFGVASPTAVEGMLPRRNIAAGLAIRAEWLQAPEVVRRGDQVPVTVVSASAVLRLHARAESSARAGERLTLTNIENGKRFEAVVDRAGEALIQVGGGLK
jgi:flagella basal body P-ring formation protein FlgA